MYVLLYLLLSVLLISCDKEASLNETTVTESAAAHLRTSADGSKKEENTDFSMLTSPLRDILRYNPEYLNTISRSAVSINAGGGGGGEDFHCCNGICLTVPTNPDPGTFYYPYDAYGNKVNYIGQYGPDDRQRYYVYLPTNVTANSPVVVMIPGGGWFSGQEVNVLGFPFNWSGSPSVSIVKDLLDKGYVVVSMIYRLVQYGENQTEFNNNPISWQNQVDDISTAINHITANFSTCLWGHQVNANKIHLLGESAGGHLALVYAYTHPGQTNLKSVISMYAPTNINQYADTLNNFTYPFTCGSGFNIPTHCPYYFPIFDYFSPSSEYNTYNPLTCTATGSFPIGPNTRIIPSYNLIQSATKQVISNPSTNNTLQLFNPCIKLLQTPTPYPTFVMHGEGYSDNIVPYPKSTFSMNNNLNTNGGLIGTYYYHPALNFPPFTSQIPPSSNYITNPQKHIIRLYYFANHGWENSIMSIKDSIRSNIRRDCITWLNGH